MVLKIYDLDRTLIWLPVNWDEITDKCLKKYGVTQPYYIPARQRKDLDFLKQAELKAVETMEVNDKLVNQIKTDNEKGVKSGIFSNNTHQTVEASVNKLGIKHAINAISALEDVENTKPNPEGVFKIMKQLGEQPENTTYYGDLPKDMQAANAAGVKFVYVNYFKKIKKSKKHDV